MAKPQTTTPITEATPVDPEARRIAAANAAVAALMTAVEDLRPIGAAFPDHHAAAVKAGDHYLAGKLHRLELLVSEFAHAVGATASSLTHQF